MLQVMVIVSKKRMMGIGESDFPFLEAKDKLRGISRGIILKGCHVFRKWDKTQKNGCKINPTWAPRNLCRWT